MNKLPIDAVMFQEKFRNWVEYKGCRYYTRSVAIDVISAITECVDFGVFLANKNVKTGVDRR